jgi:hypothetical protein
MAVMAIVAVRSGAALEFMLIFFDLATSKGG